MELVKNLGRRIPDNDEVTTEALNRRWGDRGITFKRQSMAEDYAKEYPGAIVTQLVDYSGQQFDSYTIQVFGKPHIRYNLKADAKPHVIGWLVTLPPKYWSSKEIYLGAGTLL